MVCLCFLFSHCQEMLLGSLPPSYLVYGSPSGIRVSYRSPSIHWVLWKSHWAYCWFSCGLNLTLLSLLRNPDSLNKNGSYQGRCLLNLGLSTALPHCIWISHENLISHGSLPHSKRTMTDVYKHRSIDGPLYYPLSWEGEGHILFP